MTFKKFCYLKKLKFILSLVYFRRQFIKDNRMIECIVKVKNSCTVNGKSIYYDK